MCVCVRVWCMCVREDRVMVVDMLDATYTHIHTRARAQE